MNIPNAISTFRLFLVPVFALVYFSGNDNASLYAFLVFAVAGFSDILDGYIARKFNMVTKLGRIIDPLADKLMVFTALVCTAITGNIPAIFPVLYLIKEGWQVFQTFRLADKIDDVPPANFWGKGGTFLFYVAITMGVLMPQYDTAVFIVLCMAVLFSVIAYFTYRERGKRLVDAIERAKESTEGGN